MDDEDLADAAEAQNVSTSSAFAGLGSSTRDEATSNGDFMGLLKVSGETMGTKLLRRMGWKDGQGIGPRVRRGARLDMPTDGKKSGSTDDDTFLFAPDDVTMIQFDRKTDRKGLGFEGASKLHTSNGDKESDDDNDNSGNDGKRFSLLADRRSKPKAERGGIGIGILNDNGSDEEDPYEIGPQIKYNRTIGGDKKKKKKKQSTAAASNPALGSAPVFVPKTARAGSSLRRCHDGRLPLDGFVLAKVTEDFAGLLLQYAPPPVPADWVSAKKKEDSEQTSSAFISAADAAKASNLDPKARAALLGEKALPGKSVFDYLSASARDKLAAGSGKTNLPAAKGEIPEQYRLTDEERKKRLWAEAPKLDPETAQSAISRSSGGPYADDEGKRSRYIGYLENQADSTRPPPEKGARMSDEDFLRELNEFYNCARIFKPMTGFMASRFTTAKSTTATPPHNGTGDTELLMRPEPKAVTTDPAEEAAKMGMFGNMTRKVEDFYPTRLLCKRFNVKPPANVKPDKAEESSGPTGAAKKGPWAAFESRPSSWTGNMEIKALPSSVPPAPMPESAPAAGQEELEEEPAINPERNDAVEGSAAADALKAIFGDSDSE